MVMFEGSSEVKMVALEGEIRYLAFRVARSASLNPDQIFSFDMCIVSE